MDLCLAFLGLFVEWEDLDCILYEIALGMNLEVEDPWIGCVLENLHVPVATDGELLVVFLIEHVVLIVRYPEDGASGLANQ